MAKIGLPTIISVVLNLFLTFWLVNQYMSDAYFQSYVNGTIGQYYPFIVLTLGVGGGSGLGYLFLKKRHADSDIIGKIQKSKSFKPASPMSSGVSASPSRQILPTGAPPSPASKHTVYAVPPLPKTSTPSNSRTGIGTTWAGAKPSSEPFSAAKQDSPRPVPMPTQTQRIEPPRSQPSFASVPDGPSPALNAIGSAASKPGVSWSPQPSQPAERRSDFGSTFQKPGLDTSAKQTVPSSGFPNTGQTPPQSSPVPSKWASPEARPGTSQWSEGGVRSIPPLPTKWAPPPGSTSPQDRPGPTPQTQGFPRPGPGPVPIRGPVPPQQGPPRPFVQGPPRPGDPRPVAAPRPFRPEPMRPPGTFGPQQPPPQPSQRPAAPLAGPMPQPWSPPGQSPEKKEGSSFNLPSSLPSGEEQSSARAGGDQKSSESGAGGEMDWDTALDTILKTLRKDRVGDTK